MSESALEQKSGQEINPSSEEWQKLGHEVPKSDTETTDGGSSNPEQPTQSSEQVVDSLSKEQLEYITEKLGKRGRIALIAAELSKEDRDNIVREAIDMKVKETSKEHPLITNFPIIGSLVKAGYAARHRDRARAAIKEEGNLSAAFTSLNLDPTKSRIMNSNSENIEDRAFQVLENAGYSEENQIDRASSRLNQNEIVEKMDDASQAAVKQALNEYYSGLKGGEKSKDELAKTFDEQIKDTFKGKESISFDSINRQREALESLVDDPNIQASQVKTYIDEHLTLYKASMKESINTTQKVDGIINAVDKAGLIGGVAYALIGREARSKLRGALGTIGGAGAVGAAVGAVAGAIRGVEKANVKLSNAEINAVTATDSPERIETNDQEGSEAASPNPEKAKQKENLFAIINRYKSIATGEEKYLANIEKLRDRKDANDLIDNFDQLINQFNAEDNDSRNNLVDAYAEVIARGRFSNENRVDLIRYKDNRAALEQKLSEAEKKLYGENSENVDNLLNDEDSALNKLIQEKMEQLSNNYNEANKLRTKFLIRSALVDATAGALIGASAGSLFHLVSSHLPEGGIAGALGLETAETDNLQGSQVELVEDPDGGYTVMLGDEELIGKGESSGIEFDDSGALTNESKEMLEKAGIDVKENITEHTFENATKQVDLREYFNPENKDANNLTEISSRSWITDASGRDQIMVGNTHMDGEGNIIMQVAPTANSDVTLEDMKMVLTPGNGNIDTAITVDVNPDGTIEIPAGSPAASFFDGENFQGGYAEIAREGADGHLDVYTTMGDGRPSINTLTIDNPDATYNTYDYSFTINDQSYEVSVPENITAAARMEALNGIESLKGTGEPIGYEANGDITGLTTTSGETVEVEHFEHHGGYSDTTDSYFGEKDGVYNSGASVIRSMVGEEGKGLSSGEVDRIFLEKVNSGEISEGDVVEEYLKTIGNSPEALTTTRAMMGGFEMDLNGDGVAELIDTQDEINIAADILSRDPEAYDNFVNDTYEVFYEKIEGGSIRFVDYTQEQYQFTTWGVLDKDTNNILQRLGTVGDRQTDGVGIVFVDKDGNSIYDKEIARNLWHLPEGYNLNYIADRLNCDQKTGNGFFTEQSTGNEGTGEEGTGDEGTGNEGTGNEGTGDEGTGNEGTGNEGTGEEGTGNEGTGEEGTGDEGTDIEPKDYENMERIDKNIDNDIKDDIGTEEIRHNPNPGVDERDLTEKPSSDEYQGTEVKTTPSEASTKAEPVQEKVSQDNNYSSDRGGSNSQEYSPVKENSAAQEKADSSSTPVKEAPVKQEEVKTELEDLGIE